MLYKGLLITAASGKIDGLVASHNRGGAYFKAHVIPTDPHSARQVKCRNAMASCPGLWAALSPATRQAWSDWAASHTRTNRVADQRHGTGFSEWCRWAIPRLQANDQLGAALGIGDATPRDFEAFIPTPPTAAFLDNTTLRFTYDPDAWWTADQDNALLFFLSGPRIATVNWFRGPYQLRGIQTGDPDDPLPGTLDIDTATVVPSGSKVFWRIRLTTDDHGLSASYDGSTTYTP